MTSMLSSANRWAGAKKMVWIAVGAAFWLTIPATLDAQGEDSRTWTSADGKHHVEARYVSATEKKVTLLKADGKKVTVTLDQLCEADRSYVAEQRAGQPKPSPGNTDAPDDSLEAEIRGKVSRFYLLLRRTDRTELKSLLVSAAQTSLQSNDAFLDSVTPPDRGSAPRVREVDIDDEKATAAVRLKVAGRCRDVNMIFRQEGGQWQIRALVAEDDAGQAKTIDFVAGQMLDGDGSQLDSPEQLANINQGIPSSEIAGGPPDRLSERVPGDAGWDEEATLRAGPTAPALPAGAPPFAIPPDLRPSAPAHERPLPVAEPEVGIERPLPRELQDPAVDK